MIQNNQKYVIGVDGGGTKTIAVLSNLNGKILAKTKTGPSNPNKFSSERAINNLVEAIEKVSKKYPKNKIVFVYIGLAGALERDKERKKEIKNKLLKEPKLSWLSSKNLIVERDQLVAFQTGTDQKEGVLLIAGTGSIAIGWKGKKEAIAGGWEYLLGDAGGGFWIGQKALRHICRVIDGLASKTLLFNLILKKLKIKSEGDLIRKIYQPEVVKIIASISPLVNKAAEKEDKVAKEILIEAAKKIAENGNQVIKKLGFKKESFPLVLAGSTFQSKIILNRVKKEIKKFAPKVKFIKLKEKTVVGAVKLAIKQIKN